MNLRNVGKVAIVRNANAIPIQIQKATLCTSTMQSTMFNKQSHFKSMNMNMNMNRFFATFPDHEIVNMPALSPVSYRNDI